jgi:hypothetical protein
LKTLVNPRSELDNLRQPTAHARRSCQFTVDAWSKHDKIAPTRVGTPQECRVPAAGRRRIDKIGAAAAGRWARGGSAAGDRVEGASDAGAALINGAATTALHLDRERCLDCRRGDEARLSTPVSLRGGARAEPLESK